MAQKGLPWLIGLLLLLPTSDSQQSQGLPAPTNYAEIARLTISSDATQFESVAISGDRVVGGAGSGGAAVFTVDGATYDMVKLPADVHGSSVAIDGDTVVVGDTQSGAAYIFRTSDGGATYEQVAKLMAANAVADDKFGYSVAIDGGTIVVGAPGCSLCRGGGTVCRGKDLVGECDYPGAAYIFRKSIWGTYGQVAKLKAADTAAKDYFGSSVAIASDTVVVGAKKAGVGGAVYVFHKSHAIYTRLTVDDAAKDDDFGTSVAIDGNTIVVGRGERRHRGVAHVFRAPTGGATYELVAELKSPAAKRGDSFGWPVAIDGDTVVVGAPFESGAGTYSGAAYVFRTTDGGATYGQVAKLTGSDAAQWDVFGYSVAIDGATIVIGSYGANSQKTGAVHVFKRRTPALAQDQTVNVSDISAGGGGGSGAPSFAFVSMEVAIAIFAVVGLLLFAAASKCKYRRVRQLLASDSAGDLTQDELDAVNNAADVVQRALNVRENTLNVGRAIPIIGNLMDVVGDLLRDATEFENDVEGLLIAIRRVERIKEWVKLIERNQCELRVDQAGVEEQKERVVKKIKAFKKAMRQFAKQHWCSRICTVQTHISFLLGLDTEIGAEMEALKECYEYARDAHLLEGINEIQTRLEESNKQVLELLRKNSLEALFQQPEVLALWRGLFYSRQDRRDFRQGHRDGQVEMSPLHDTSSTDVSMGLTRRSHHPSPA